MCVHIFFLIHFVSHSHGMADDASLFYTTLQPPMLKVPRQYVLHVIFILAAPSLDGVLDCTAAPVRSAQLIPVHQQAKYTEPRPHRRSSRLGQLGKDCGVVRRLLPKPWGQAWEGDLSSTDARTDLDSTDGARKMYASPVQDRRTRASKCAPSHRLPYSRTPLNFSST